MHAVRNEPVGLTGAKKATTGHRSNTTPASATDRDRGLERAVKRAAHLCAVTLAIRFKPRDKLRRRELPVGIPRGRIGTGFDEIAHPPWACRRGSRRAAV